MSIVGSFLYYINFFKNYKLLKYTSFDYIIYIYYCVLHKNYKIINLNDFNIYTPMDGWSLEINLTKDILNKLVKNNIEINW